MASVILDYSQNFQKVESIAQLRTYPLIGVRHGDTLLVVGSTTIADGGGGIYVWNEDSELEDNGGSVIQPIVEQIAGRWLAIAVTTGAGPKPRTYTVPVSWSWPPEPSEVLMLHCFTHDVDFGINWEGSTASVGVPPSELLVFDILLDNIQVGSVEIDSDGNVNWVNDQEFTAPTGSVLSFQSSPNSGQTIANTALSFRGIIKEL